MSKENSIREENKIKVYNYSPARVAVQGRLRGYLFEPQSDGFPTFEIMSFDEIEYINSKSPVFRNGALRFDAAQEEDIFDELGYDNYKDTLLSEEDIKDMLSNPSAANQHKILAIRDLATFERVRGYAVHMENASDTRISSVITKLLDQRFNEIQRNIVVSKIPVREDESFEAHNAEVDAVKVQNAMLMAQLNEMRAQMDQMMAAQKEAAKAAKPAPAKRTTAKKPPAAKEVKPASDAE